ncbi:merozoite surface protein 3b [Budviciaceae bacterium BWR-B9]|uniref:Merozoite surface protein 3b n=2 Tax=Budviciaceae TaxID=1903416 RepID=A0ABS1IQY8_9GAMM|nr:merozoite surface protein 3b [Limnobaculum allomyrinae]MBV7692084.1 merozoite surface protein 3b [Limnobaculum sp. M2-1]
MMNSIVSYTDRAVQKLKQLGIIVAGEPEAPVMTLLDAISNLDNNRVVAIARTLQQQSSFNAIVRDNIMGMDIANRQGTIVAAFDSIRNDAQNMVTWLDDGKLDLVERVKNGWMVLVRGSIPDRFNKIKETYMEVAKASSEQISRERTILDAYQDFRFGLKQAQIDAQELLTLAEKNLEQCKTQLQAAHEAREHATTTDAAELARLELSRDEALRLMQKEDERYQIVKDLTENLLVAYNSAEAVFARLQQTSSVKERVYRQSVVFFSTNEIVFTALSASMTSLSGLSESTKTLEAMKDGINKGLETIAEAGNKHLEAGLRAGYGSTIKAESIRSLVNAITSYQESSHKLIEELRVESTNNAKELENIVEDGKRRFSEIVLKAAVE